MSTISRRQFLQLSGMTSLSMALPALNIGWNAFDQVNSSRINIRLLKHTQLLKNPTATSEALASLWADSVHSVVSVHDGWVQLQGGYVSLNKVQIMIEADPKRVLEDIKDETWVEVIAPIVALRQYASTQAPMIYRLGNGAVLPVDYSLRDDDGVLWLRSERGWLQAAHAQQIFIEEENPIDLGHLTVDCAMRQVYLEAEDEECFRADCTCPATLPPITKITTMTAGSPVGVPWVIHFDQNVMLTGVPWHNDFGQASRRFIPDRVELSTGAAQLLYRLLKRTQSLTIEVCS